MAAACARALACDRLCVDKNDSAPACAAASAAFEACTLATMIWPTSLAANPRTKKTMRIEIR